MSKPCTCLESYFWVIAYFLAEKLNSLDERELVAVSGCRAEDLGRHSKDST